MVWHASDTGSSLQVLVLQLMRFRYEGMRSVKVASDVAFDEDLQLLPSMFADGAPRKNARYRLLSTVTHLGASLHFVAACDLFS